MQTDSVDRKRRAGSTPPREQTTTQDIERTDFAASVIRQLRAELHSEFNASLDRAVDRVSCSLLERLNEVKDDVDEAKKAIAHTSNRQDALEKDFDEKYDMLQKEIAALREESKVGIKEWPLPSTGRWTRAAGSADGRHVPPSSAASTTDGLNDDWDKPPNPKIIRINTADAVSIDDIKKSIADLITSMDLDAPVRKISSPNGKKLGNRWILEFPAKSAPAATVDAVLGAMRQADGWRRPECRTPSGGRTQVYLGPDKNIKQVKVEVAAKALSKLLGSMYPTKTFVHRKADGSVSTDYKRIARVVVTKDGSHLEFNVPILSTLDVEFDKEEVKRRWSLDAKGGAASWST